MYSIENFNKDKKRWERDIRQTKPVMIFLIILTILAILILIVGSIVKNYVACVLGITFCFIGLLHLCIVYVGYKYAKKTLNSMNQDSNAYIKFRNEEEDNRLKRRLQKKSINQRTLEEDIDDFILFDELDEED